MPRPAVSPGRLLERRGDAAPRGMTVAARTRVEQNPAYRPTPRSFRAWRGKSAASFRAWREIPERYAFGAPDANSPAFPAAVAASPLRREGGLLRSSRLSADSGGSPSRRRSPRDLACSERCSGIAYFVTGRRCRKAGCRENSTKSWVPKRLLNESLKFGANH